MHWGKGRTLAPENKKQLKSKTNMKTIYDVFKQQVTAILKEAGETISQLMKEGKMHRKP